MKIELFENDHGIDIILVPETIVEISQLLRYTNNAKKVKPHLFMSFRNEPYCSIHLKKVDKSVQSNTISKY